MSTPDHPLDQALDLRLLQGPDAAGEVIWQGRTHDGYNNMVGPYGGVTAAQVLQSVLRHPQLVGTPAALTVNYAAALAYGPFEVATRPVRTNRSTQHWLVLMRQRDEQGRMQEVISATVMTAVRRETFSRVDHAMPPVPKADGIAPFQFPPNVAWLQRYEQRLVDGTMHMTLDGSEHSSQTTVWFRDQPPRPLDFVGLTGLADVFAPRIWLRRALRVPAGTVSMTVYYHADAAKLAQTGTRHVLGQARMQAAFNGYCDQSAALWAPDGELLASSHQLVYFKE